MNVLAYPEIVRALLDPPRLPPLGPGTPNRAALAALKKLRPEDLGSVRDQDAAAACLAGLWLYHDFLDESHGLSQDLHTVEGSYWHGLMHRREPDASNASYWFRRVGEHPIFEALVKEAQNLGLQIASGRWNPFDFIDWCESHRGAGTELEMLLRKVQRREWELLFDWCLQRAASRG